MTICVSSHDKATLDMPFPRLSEGRFSSCTVLTDEELYAACGIRVAFTQRTGGTSLPPYDSLNLGGHVGDDSNAVEENKRIFFEALGAADVSYIQPNQVHGDRLVICSDSSDARACSDCAQEGADGVVVACRDVAALLCFADCVPVIVASPTGTFSVVHAGWRGVMARIAESAVREICRIDGVSPSALNVYIGPHIKACHFEVGVDLAQRFSDEFGPNVVCGERHVDMAAALRSGLCACGVDPRRIVEADACTVCDRGERYFSYRHSGGVTGRHSAFAVRVS